MCFCIIDKDPQFLPTYRLCLQLFWKILLRNFENTQLFQCQIPNIVKLNQRKMQAQQFLLKSFVICTLGFANN